MRFLIQAIIILIRAQQPEREINSLELPSIFRIHIVDDNALHSCADANESPCEMNHVLNIVVQMVMKHIQIWHLLFDYCVGKSILTMCASFVIPHFGVEFDEHRIKNYYASISISEERDERKYPLKFGTVAASAPGLINRNENPLEHRRADNKRMNL